MCRSAFERNFVSIGLEASLGPWCYGGEGTRKGGAKDGE